MGKTLTSTSRIVLQIWNLKSNEYNTLILQTDTKTTSYHAYLLRLKNVTEAQRDAVMQKIFEQEVTVNVHFIPLPLLTCYKSRGYNITDYPVAYDNFSREISLPVYYDLTDEQVETVIAAVKNAF